MSQEENDEFRPWLRRRGLTYDSFAKAVRVSCYTIAELGSGDNWVPRDRIADLIRKKFPRCPLLLRKPRNSGMGRA